MKLSLWQLKVGLAASVWAPIAGAAAPAGAPGLEPFWPYCVNLGSVHAVDLQIAGCGAIIRSPLAKPADLAAAYRHRGEARNRKQQYARAIADFSEAIRLDPKLAAAFSGRGDAYASLDSGTDNQARAEADYEQAARLDPATFGAGEPPEVAAGVPVAQPAVNAAIDAALALGDRSKREAVELDRQARSLFEQGRYGEAEVLFRRGLKVAGDVLGDRDPVTLVLLNNLAATLNLLGRAVEAEPLIRQAYSRSIEVRGERHPRTLDSLNNLGGNLMNQGRHNEAEPILRKVLQVRSEVLGERDPQVLDSMNALSVNLMDQGRSAESEALLRKTVQMQSEVLGEQHPDTLNSMGNLAAVLMDEDRAAEAEPLFRKALQALTQSRGESHPQSLGFLHNLAVNIRHQDRFAEAEPLFRKALKLQTEGLGERHPDALRTLGNLATDLVGQGRNAEAFPMFKKTLELQVEVLGERHQETLGTAFSVALIGSELGPAGAVEPMLQRALELQREVLGARHPQTLASAMLLAGIRLKMPPAADALTPARMAVAGWRARQETQEASASIEAGLAREALQNQAVYLVLAEAAWRAALAAPEQRGGMQSEAYSALQDSMAGAASRALAQAAARNAAEGGAAGLGALARERQEQSDRWRDNNLAQTKALGRPNDPTSTALRQRLDAEQVKIEAEIARIDTRLRADFPNYFALVRPTPLDLKTTQDLLKPDEAILVVVPTAHGTQVMAVTRDAFVWERSEWTSDKVAAAVRRLLWDVGADVGVDKVTAFQWVNEGGAGYPFDRKTAYNLYQQIIAPIARALDGKRQLFIATGGALTSLPFGFLVTQPPQGKDGDPQALRATKWFADAHALTVIPSIQSLQYLRRAAPANTASPAAASFAGYGDPVLEGEAQSRGKRTARAANARSMFMGRTVRSAGAIADTSQLKLLARLPGTAVELESMRTALGAPASSVHMQRDATEVAFRSADLSQVRVLAIATHGLMAGELTGSTEPGLVFTPPAQASERDDGLLTTSEIAGLRLNADWVILSACNTASGDGSEGAPGLSGLARAFFYAGARDLLVSHWPVRDDVASRLTVEAIKLQQADPALSRAEALQRAMRSIRDDASHDTATDSWAHPNAWAPFSLIGDGAR